MNIYEKLGIIQSKLKAPKGQYNSFGKYKYRSCEDILEAVKPLLTETRTVLSITDQMEVVGDRIYVRSEAHLKDCDDTGEIVTVAYAREEESKKGMDSSQVTGAASSYARKYALNGLFCIDDNKDSDSKGSDLPMEEATKILQMIAKGHKFTLHYFSPYYGVWRDAPFYVGQTQNIAIGELSDDRKIMSSLEFNMTGVNPL